MAAEVDEQTDQQVEERTRPLTGDGDEERFAHIIRRSDEMRGYVLGEAVTALCGKKWVPSRDPSRYPVCPSCREILAVLRSESSGDREG